MRKESKIALIVAIAGIMYASCQPTQNEATIPKMETVQCPTNIDTFYLPEDSRADTAVIDCRHKIDSVYLVNRRLADSFLLYKLKMNNVNKYVDIVVRNPTQLKFLKGWVNRVNK